MKQRSTSRSPGQGTVTWAILLALAPVTAAHAYVDPNAAGPLFQLLFPMIVAITSVLAGWRRTLVQAWKRLLGSSPAQVDTVAETETAERQ
jgi:hypothetical protein